MENRLYVGNISYQMTEDDLNETFGKIGTVTSARIITNAISGRSKGFGFVEMETEELAKQAIEQLDGTEILGRTVRVAPARPPRERSDGGGGGGGGREPQDYNR